MLLSTNIIRNDSSIGDLQNTPILQSYITGSIIYVAEIVLLGIYYSEWPRYIGDEQDINADYISYEPKTY